MKPFTPYQWHFTTFNAKSLNFGHMRIETCHSVKLNNPFSRDNSLNYIHMLVLGSQNLYQNHNLQKSVECPTVNPYYNYNRHRSLKSLIVKWFKPPNPCHICISFRFLLMGSRQFSPSPMSRIEGMKKCVFDNSLLIRFCYPKSVIICHVSYELNAFLLNPSPLYSKTF